MTNKMLFLSFICALLSVGAFAQTQPLNMDNPGDYMTAVFNARANMDAVYMKYISAVAHGKKAKKVEKDRQDVLDNISDCKIKTGQLPDYKGDNSLKKASIDYIQLCYRVFNEDYQKIVNTEDIAEQSVDEMEAYLLLQKMVSQKLSEGNDQMEEASHAFAAKYNVKLTDPGKSELNKKLEIAGKLNTYMNNVYLCFFKCNWEDNQMVQAMNNKKVSDVEQARSALARYAEEGLKALDTLKAFDGDPSLANSCREILTFYKKTAETDVPKMSDLFVKQEDFDKLKKTFDANSDHTKEDVNNYNKAVKDVNASAGVFNQLNAKVNNGRTQALNNWNATDKKFADEHMPHYKH